MLTAEPYLKQGVVTFTLCMSGSKSKFVREREPERTQEMGI